MAEGTADQPRRWWTFAAYVSERAWGTVGEDHSADGRSWDYLPHGHAHPHAYRWSEDGLKICDVEQRLCFALAFWNGSDPILTTGWTALVADRGRRVHRELERQ